jgi:hypothetical protein
MGRKPFESDFEVEVFKSTIAVRFWPSRSLYTFTRSTTERDVAEFGPVSPSPCHQARLAHQPHPSVRRGGGAGDGVPACDRGGSSVYVKPPPMRFCGVTLRRINAPAGRPTRPSYALRRHMAAWLCASYPAAEYKDVA